LSQSGQDLSLIPARSIEEARLARRVTRAETLFTELQSAYQSRSLAAASSIPDLRILDAATVPMRPSNDERLRLVAIVMIGFIGLGIAIAILLDRFDPRLRTPQQLLTAFGLTVLGVVPRIRRSGGKGGIANLDQVREAFRELRTGIDFAYGFAGPIVFTVTSSGASEGKTLISSNLGVSFSELRRRTLLIDADTRRGTLHTSFGANRRPGLTDYLNGHASLEDVLQHTDHEGLDIIAMGTLVAESPELLSSPKMRELIAAVRPLYDVIIVDSPPLGAGADPLVLSVLTGNLLMVVRSGTTDREFTQAKLEPLGRLPVRFLGAVLNDFIPDRLSGSKYYASYLPGYEAKSEDPGDGNWTPKAIVADTDAATVASDATPGPDSTR
jgi:capsular exopolysaccharide synthesis family protein